MRQREARQTAEMLDGWPSVYFRQFDLPTSVAMPQVYLRRKVRQQNSPSRKSQLQTSTMRFRRIPVELHSIGMHPSLLQRRPLLLIRIQMS